MRGKNLKIIIGHIFPKEVNPAAHKTVEFDGLSGINK